MRRTAPPAALPRSVLGVGLREALQRPPPGRVELLELACEVRQRRVAVLVDERVDLRAGALGDVGVAVPTGR